MADATLTIDLQAIIANWRALKAHSGAAQTAAVVKADAYGLGLPPVARALAGAGAKVFFVALASEGAALRAALGPGPEIFVFSGLMEGDAQAVAQAGLIPLLNSPGQVAAFLQALPGHVFGLQLDSGMNRLGLEAADLADVRSALAGRVPKLTMSHLAAADTPDHALNAAQLASFQSMSAEIGGPRSLAATGGILLGPLYHFDLTRPGVGLYGGLPFEQAVQVVSLALPVIQIRDVAPGEIVGYGGTWRAARPSRVATVSAGYADGLARALSGARLFSDAAAVPVVGRISMDLITVDVTDLPEVPSHLEVLGPHQSIDDLAANAGTIGYEILTSLGPRYERRYIGV